MLLILALQITPATSCFLNRPWFLPLLSSLSSQCAHWYSFSCRFSSSLLEYCSSSCKLRTLHCESSHLALVAFCQVLDPSSLLFFLSLRLFWSPSLASCSHQFCSLLLFHNLALANLLLFLPSQTSSCTIFCFVSVRLTYSWQTQGQSKQLVCPFYTLCPLLASCRCMKCRPLPRAASCLRVLCTPQSSPKASRY